MFVVVVRFPAVPAARDAEFRAWFAWSNDRLRGFAGLAGRRLLRGADGAYVGLVEHESAATFAEMHASAAAAEVQQHLHGILEGAPQPEVYDVIDAGPVTGCCGGAGAAHRPGGNESVGASERNCCQGS